MLKNLEDDARRLNTTVPKIAVFILEKRRIAPLGAPVKICPKGALRPLSCNSQTKKRGVS
ncbi:MAG: hypothetical protein FWF96_02300 [Kiritimatiellaeota bacterium]|nr:hypothetical protein [Kiritimatiellota bacterium]